MSQNHAAFIENHIVRRFNILKKIGSGAYGHVWKVQQKATKKIYALKKIFDAFQHATDAQRTYREIEILKQLDHPNIIKLCDTIRADNNKDVYLVFQFMEADLHNVISQGILKDVHIRFIIYQMAKSLKYMHTASIIHRDLKPSNILVNSNCTIKLCDFGLVRSLKPNNQNLAVLTEGVATRWYRAPQVLLGSKSYSTPADIWSFGCIIYEILAQKPLFPGNSTLDQVQKICMFTGYPSQDDITSLQSEVSKSMIKQLKISSISKQNTFLKDLSAPFVDLLQKIIVFNPNKRLKIDDILSHEIVKAFRKPQQQISCNKIISTSIDDNKKFSVDQYRKLIYGGSPNKNKVLSSSLGSGITSSKYLPTQNKTLSNYSSASNLITNAQTKKVQSQKQPQMSKKYSYQKLRTVTTVQPNTYTKASEAIEQKKTEKPLQKYVKSSKDFSTKSQLMAYHSYKKVQTPKVEGQIQKQQSELYKKALNHETKKEGYISYNNYSKTATKTHYDNNNKAYSNGSNSATVNHVNSASTGNINEENSLSTTTWKAIRSNLAYNISPKDIKDKGYLYKSPKYININKSETFYKPTIGSTYNNKIDNNDKPQ